MSVPTPFTWPGGPQKVEVSGDWDNWAERIRLDKQGDGSFSKTIPMPANKRVHYKFIVDETWTTRKKAPTTNDAGNINNIMDIGDAPENDGAAANTAKPAQGQNTTDSAEPVDGQSTTDKAKGAIGGAAAGAAAGAAGIAAAASGAFSSNDESRDGLKPENTPPEVVDHGIKKSEPGNPIKEAADNDIRNNVPTSVSNAAHGVVPAIAGAVATVTGADIMRGNPTELTPSAAEARQAQADSSQDAAGVATLGGYVVDPSKAPNDNAKAGAATATTAAAANKLDQPAVAVGDAGFAANVDPAREAAGKKQEDVAGAVASRGEADRNTSAAKVSQAAGVSSQANTPATSLPGSTGTIDTAKPVDGAAGSVQASAAKTSQGQDDKGSKGAIAGAAAGAGALGAAGVAGYAGLSSKDDSQKHAAVGKGDAATTGQAPDGLASGQSTYGVLSDTQKTAPASAASATTAPSKKAAPAGGVSNASSVPPGVAKSDAIPKNATAQAPSNSAASKSSNGVKPGMAAGAGAVGAAGAGAVGTAAAAPSAAKSQAGSSSRAPAQGGGVSSGNNIADQAKVTGAMAPSSAQTSSKPQPAVPSGQPATTGRTSSAAAANGTSSSAQQASGNSAQASQAAEKESSKRMNTLTGRRKSKMNLNEASQSTEDSANASPSKRKGLFSKIKHALTK